MLPIGHSSRWMTALFGILAVVIPISQKAAAQEYRIAQPPAWVEIVQPSDPSDLPLNQVSDGVYYLLSDQQVQVASGTVSRFYNTVRKVLNSEGAKTAAQIAIDFDPEYEVLTIHAVRIHRKEQVMDRLPAARISVLQRETQREYLLYDGARTVEIILDDVRAGDVVEHSFTISGQNPVFEGKYYEFMGLGWGIPVHEVRRRLIWPTDRDLNIRTFNSEIQPKIKEMGARREYLWKLDRVGPTFAESNLPSWYDPYPMVQLSETGIWSEVVEWALGLYAADGPFSPDLIALADHLGAGRPPREKILAVLRFVQEEIRYLGLEMGPDSHAPSDPSEVLRRRFGDCKDKTRLALALLHRLGIRAHPALVHTYLRHEVDRFLPAPTVFNHVLLRVQVDGDVYWLDPTNSHQGGNLETLEKPRFGMALVIAPETIELTPMESTGKIAPTRKVEEIFDLRAGIGEPAKYTVRSICTGSEADSLRAQLAGASREELRRSWLNFYAASYPSMLSDGDLEISDDLAANRIVLVEHYTIPGMWRYDAIEKRQEADVFSPEIGGILQTSGTPRRTMPLALRHPLHVRVETEVLLPEDWEVQSKTMRIYDEAFLFDRSVEYSDRRLVLTSEYRSLLDHVSPENMGDYFANLERARNEIGYFLYVMDEVAQENNTGSRVFGDVNWPIAIFAVVLVCAYVVLARKLYHWNPYLSMEPIPDPNLAGISGWLLLPALGVLVNPIKLLVELMQYRWIFSRSSWLAVTTPGSETYHSALAPLLTFELIVNIGILFFSLLLLVLFFKRRSSLPRLYIYFLAGTFLFGLIDHWASLSIPSIAKTTSHAENVALFRQGFFALVWGLYFARSSRVRATFTVTRSGSTSMEKEPVQVHTGAM